MFISFSQFIFDHHMHNINRSGMIYIMLFVRDFSLGGNSNNRGVFGQESIPMLLNRDSFPGKILSYL